MKSTIMDKVLASLGKSQEKESVAGKAQSAPSLEQLAADLKKLKDQVSLFEQQLILARTSGLKK